MENSIDNLKTFDDDFTPYAAELKEGQLLGENKNYRLEKILGAGGMGEVWLASEIRGGVEIRKVVVKTLRPDRRENLGAQAKALEQFRLIQKLNHQNICPIYVIEHDPACGYLIVMGYADGGSYADWFDSKPKPLAEVCDVLRPIADALDHAHKFGVIHRDVKPENMMFMLFNGIRVSWLIDFGIATHLRSESMATMGQFSSSGTASYMAPEQKEGQLQTAQTDEYSLAMVALEFLTGSLSPLSALLLSPEIQPILVKALAPEPSARYTTCRAFIDALASAGTTLPASSKPVVQVVQKPSLKAGDRKIWTASGIEYPFRWCPPGEFMMGGDKYDFEKPVHKVKITKGFWLLETEVTQKMWESVMGESIESKAQQGTWRNDLKGKGDTYPMYYVSWDDSQSFCRKLSQKLGQRVQLPTEAQWEYACRAGTTGDYAGTLDEMAWYRDNSGGTTHAVGQKKPNAWGLYDMHGNVWEWCSDYWDKEYYSKSPTSDPENTTASSSRVDRGGSWSDYAGCCRSAARDGSGPVSRYCYLGLRVLLVPSPAE